VHGQDRVAVDLEDVEGHEGEASGPPPVGLSQATRHGARDPARFAQSRPRPATGYVDLGPLAVQLRGRPPPRRSSACASSARSASVMPHAGPAQVSTPFRVWTP
jgi:hypothetical protein